MKTNQIMQLQFDDYQLEIGHKDMMGNLNNLWSIGNAMRVKRGLSELYLTSYLRSSNTLNFIIALEAKLGLSVIRDISETTVSSSHVKTIKSPLIKTKEGRYGGTFVHKYILLHASNKFGAEFQIFIYDKILELDNILTALNDFEVDSEILELSPKPLYVYAIRETDSGNIKIGISANPESRLKQLQTGNSSQLELVTFIEAKDRFKTEKELHLLNADKHIRGEWFDANATIGD